WLVAGGFFTAGGSPQSELARLQARADQPDADWQSICPQVLAFRMKYPDTPEAFRASQLLLQLRSPLDDLGEEKIDPKQESPTILKRVFLWPGNAGTTGGVRLSPDCRILTAHASGQSGVKDELQLFQFVGKGFQQWSLP